MANYKLAVDKLIDKEGGFVNDPQDTGGMTYKGISRNNWPTLQLWDIVDELDCKTNRCYTEALDANDLVQEYVTRFYYDNFWNKLSLNKINSQVLAELLFEIGVHSGTKHAALLLQKAANNLILSHRNANWNKLKEDGILGNDSASVINEIANRGSIDILLIEIKFLQIQRYKAIIINRPGNKKFYAGWLRRLF